MLFRLAERGATDVLVPNLPDVGMTPAARLAGQTEIDRAECLTPRFKTKVWRPFSATWR